jgi:EPS-associated MarR family transcriptional regulator
MNSNIEINLEQQLSILRKVESAPDQKSLASQLGYSIGKVNYILKALIEKGYIKTERFIHSRDKKGYKYLLTQEGIKEKIKLTESFVEIKRREYEELKRELEENKK